jgi:hypothetical protein
MLLLLVSVRQERLLQLPRFRGLRHFRQVLEDLTLGKINILERIKEKVVEFLFSPGQTSCASRLFNEVWPAVFPLQGNR